jgi:hypothetical protein
MDSRSTLTELLGDLDGDFAVRSIGDCVAPRRLSNAIYEANRVIRSMSSILQN